MNSQREDLIKNIVNECKEREVRVTRDLVSFALSLLQLNPTRRFKDNEEDSERNMITEVVNKLCDETKPSLVTLKSQLYFGKHYYEKDEMIKRHRLALHHKTRPLVLEIIESENAETSEDIEKLYQKILIVITLLSGLGSPTDPCILREVTVALQSVFQPSELPRYVTLSRRQKEEQLMELMCIVAGIRLFNRDCQRGGEGIDDLPEILQTATDRTRKTILDLLEELLSKIYKFTAAVENITSSNEAKMSCCRESQERVLPRDVTKEDAEWSIEMLTACRQQEVYIRKLLNDVEGCESEVQNLTQRLQYRLLKLHDTVRYRTAIPTLQVYPQFVDLADIWMSLQDEVIVLSGINALLWELIGLGAESVNVYNQTMLESLLEGIEVLSDAERQERSSGELIKDCGECSIYYPDSAKDLKKIHLELLGFCPWMFVVGKGALIPGNPNNGIVKWKGKFYSFSSCKAAEEFGNDPDRWIYEVLDFTRNHPEYVHFFQLHDDIESLKSREILTEKGPELKTTRHQIVQTDTHILPPSIDRNYSSNIWELRRRALSLASVSGCATRSTQTQDSHFRRCAGVQAAPVRATETQTRRDNSTNTKKPKSYICGLRGRRDDQQRVVSFLEDEVFGEQRRQF